MSGHTPGRWFVEHASLRVLSDDLRATIVCEVTGSPSNPQAAADARLIAAAPDLLGRHEADIEALEALAKAIHAGDPMPELVIRVTDMLVAKRAAIAKATGEPA